MPAPKGNRFWEARSTHGRKPIFSDPEELFAACIEYFEWVEENPLLEAFQYQGKVSEEGLCKMRAMTMAGLCNFLDIGTSTWDDYRNRDAFSEVIARVEQVLRQQKFEGAAAGLLNPNIIARDLGLSEKNEHTGADGGPIKTEDTSAVALLEQVLNAKSRRQTSEPEPD